LAQLLLLSEYRRDGRRVFFDREDLNHLLGVYSRQVARGVWRDYALDHRSNMAIFSIFKRSQEQAIFTVTKVLLRGDKEPNYVLLSRNRQIKSSRDLRHIVEALQRQLTVIEA
jgi:hypothetical protein